MRTSSPPQGTRRTRGFIPLILGVLGVLGGGELAFAQFQMPDAKEMSGIPRPVDDLPNGSVSVRLVRGGLSNNIANHTIELHVGSKVLTAKTDEAGRAQFDALAAGDAVKASADVEGEHLESAEFPAPSQGGIRLLLVATDRSKPARAEPSVAATTGEVVIGTNSRILIQPGEETLQVYYLLDIRNAAPGPVKTVSPFTFELPQGARCSPIEDSSPLAVVKGTNVLVDAPFPSGSTYLQIGCELAVSSGSFEITHRFPATFEEFVVLVKRVGDTKLTSPQLTRVQDMPAQGDVYIAATGPSVPAGQPLVLSLAGLPHHSAVPRWIALALAFGIVIVGVWAGTRSAADAPDERKRLLAQRDKLFNDLVRLERDYRSGRVDEARYKPRRNTLVAALERVYGALDQEGIGPDPVDRTGLAA